MCKLRIINTQAYAEEVAKKKVRAKTAKPKVGPTLRQVKRKLCTVLKQNKKLRGKVGVCSVHLWLFRFGLDQVVIAPLMCR